MFLIANTMIYCKNCVTATLDGNTLKKQCADCRRENYKGSGVFGNEI